MPKLKDFYNAVNETSKVINKTNSENPTTNSILKEYYNLDEKAMIAGAHDIKETLKIVDEMFKKYGVKPKVKFVGRLQNSAYAIYDWMKNVMYVNTSVNKTIKDFLMTVLHELYHAIQTKKAGGGKKFEKEYEKEQNMIAQGHKKGKHNPYDDNVYEIEAEKFAVKNWKYWEKRLDAHLKMRTDRHKGKHYKGK